MQKLSDFGVAGIGRENVRQKACFVATVDHGAVVDQEGEGATEALLGCQMDAGVSELEVREELMMDRIEEIDVERREGVEEVQYGEIVF